ncbi:MAG: cellulase family glycosylhydrolase [Balneolales bacterium]|nr:cellulase family glycosylhydrolase [Balneolales bacterium]
MNFQKSVSYLAFVLLFTAYCTPLTAQELPFTKGVNLTNWFQAGSPEQIDFSKYTKQDFENIRSLGADVIRLPINLHSMVGDAPDYALDSLFLFFLDQAVDWAEELEMNLILDNHTFDPSVATDPDIGDILVPVWTQLAAHYEPTSTNIFYEVLNEPHGISNNDWNAIQSEVIDAIRTVDTKHTIIVGPSDYNSYHSLQFMPEYADTNLIYTFHFYEPFVLTHQGATWTNPSLASLADVPFPYDAATMPALPNNLAGTWVEGVFNNYTSEGNADYVKSQIDIAVNFAETRGVTVFCGEFGIYIPNSDNDSRVAWYGIVVDYLEEHGIPWTSWDYQGGFGIFEEGTSELFEHHINVPLVEAMGFNVPPQTEFEIEPDTVGFDLYADYIASGVTGSHNSNNGTLTFYNEEDSGDGEFSIYWTNATQYEHIGFDFRPDKDLSWLVAGEAVLEMDVRAVGTGSFDLRFIDTKTGENDDRPWRVNLNISSSDFTWDGTWQKLEIPLSDFPEMGSWDENQWFNPQGDYDWSAVDVFQIVSEQGILDEAQIWFDNIKIVGEGVMVVSNEEVTQSPDQVKLFQNYPNPFNPVTQITFELVQGGNTTLKVYDIVGREVAILTDEFKNAGSHTINFDGTGLSSGVYFYVLKSGDVTVSERMALLK